MSYDPFLAAQSHQHHQHTYHDSADYDPYGQSTPQPHASYDDNPTPYKDEGALPPAPMAQENKEFDPFQPPPKSTGDLRMWRHDHHGNLWTKGGRARCIGRFCCCTLMSAFLLFAGILLTLAAFLRPPDIQFGGITPIATNAAVNSSSTDLSVPLGIQISVRNPNYFTVTLQSIKVNVTYPINNTPVGGGVLNSVVFKTNTKTTFNFPFLFHYSLSSDPNGTIITDMATKCGFLPGSAKQQFTVGYTLKLALQVAGITISPPFSGNTQFDCPLTLSNIQPFISNVPGLSSLLGGSIP